MKAVGANSEQVVWNFRMARKLILLLSWLGFHYIGNDMKAESISYWKSKTNMLYAIVKLLHKRQKETDGFAKFNLPEPEDIPALLAIVCEGAPKIRYLVKLVAALVVLMKRKLLIWCATPASQILIYAILQALNIDSVCYTSDIPCEEREKKRKLFTTSPNQAWVFIGGFYMVSVGLNLQGNCHHQLNFDTPQNRGIGDQATGRLLRMMQRYTVMRIELNVEVSFQSRIIELNLMKALEGGAAELGIDVIKEKTIEDGEQRISIGKYYMLDGMPLKEGDPRLKGLKLDRLSVLGLVMAIFNNQHGPIEDVVAESAEKGVVWVSSDEDEAEEGDDKELDGDALVFN